MEIAKGAKILVTRSGGVIPKILQTLIPATEEEQHEMWDELAFCPHCGEPTSWNSSYKELMCTNPDCPGIKLAKIIFFFTICGAENMGEETFTKLYDAGFTSIKAILNMTASDVMSIDGFGENMASIIAENTNKIKAGVELPTLMQASDCFTGIGKVKAQKITEELTEESLEDLYDDEVIIDVETNKELVKEAENETWRSFFQGYNAFKKFIKDNGLTVKEPEKVTVDANGQFKGMSICFSGVRDASLEQRIVAGGGAIASGVSKNTTHLVVKDKSGTSSKISKANQLGIPIIQIDEFDDFFKV
jgi:NAD-dependent DNA ligase